MLVLSENVKDYLSIPVGNYKLEILEGSAATGKTELIGLPRFIEKILKTTEFHQHAIITKSIITAEKNIVARFLEYVPFAKYSRMGDGGAQIRFGKHKIFILAGGDAGSHKSLRGLRLINILIDELNLITEQMWADLMRASAPYNDNFTIATLNPDNPALWIYEQIIDKCRPMAKWADKIPSAIIDAMKKQEPNPKGLYVHFSQRELTYLSKEKLAELEHSYSGVHKQRFLYGNRVAGEGLVYPEFADNFAKYMITGQTELPRLDYYVGLDIGDRDKTALVLIGVDYQQKAVYALDEWVQDNSKCKRIGMADITRIVMETMQRWSLEHGIIKAAYFEYATGGSLVQIDYNKDRYKYGLANTMAYNCLKLPINERIIKLNKLIGNFKFYIHSNCNGLMTELRNCAWETKASVDKRQDGRDDIINAFEYALSMAWKQL